MTEEQRSILLYAAKRLLLIIPVLFITGSLVCIALSFAPGDPAVLILGPEATAQRLAEVRAALGLNNPWYVQYFDFVKNLVLHGDLGRSYQSGRPVIEEIARTLPVSTYVAFIGLVLSTTIAVVVGVISAVRQYSVLDNVIKITVLAGVSMPIFWLGLVLIVVFSVMLRVFPSSGWGSWRHMILPSIALSAYPLATLTRLTRSTMLEVIRQDYIRTARAKGVPENLVIFKHALKNAFIPVITMIGVQFGILIGSSVLTETVFAIPGLGRLIVTAIFSRDYTTIRGGVLICTAIVALINLLVDLSYAFFDPRIRY